MKRKNRIIFMLVAFILSICLLTPTVFADGADMPDNESADATVDGITDGTEKEGDTEGGAVAEDTSEENPFESVFNILRESATELFSLLTLIGSLILAYTYKKGLLPTVQGGIGAISAAVVRIKESQEKGEGAAARLGEEVTERLDRAESVLLSLSEGVEELSLALKSLAESEDDRAKMKLIISAQIDMLYDVFMSSSLPQYQKDAVGNRVRAMKEALGDNAGKENG